MGAPQGFDPKEILHRIGTFFLLVGIGVLVLFMASEAQGKITLDYFCSSLLFILIGLFFRGQYKKPAPSSGRFSLVRRLMPKAKKEDQGKKK